MLVTLAIDKDKFEPDFLSLSINIYDGKGGGRGTRLTPQKASGSYETVKEWKMTEDDLIRMQDAIEEALHEVQNEC